MKKKLIFLLLIPLFVAASVTSTYLIIKIGLDGVVIPDWYKEKAFEPAPVLEFINYWKNKSFTYGLIAGVVTLAITTVLYFYEEKYKKW